MTDDERRHETLARALYDDWRRECPGEPSWSRLREREQDRWLRMAETARTVWAMECDGRAQSFLDALYRNHLSAGKKPPIKRRVAA